MVNIIFQPFHQFSKTCNIYFLKKFLLQNAFSVKGEKLFFPAETNWKFIKSDKGNDSLMNSNLCQISIFSDGRLQLPVIQSADLQTSMAQVQDKFSKANLSMLKMQDCNFSKYKYECAKKDPRT